MKRILIAVGAAALVSAAFAQTQQPHVHNAEAAPDVDTKSQAAAEAHKATKKSGAAVHVKDGSTARGQGSGIPTTSKTEAAGQARADVREATPHDVPKQGGTPK